MTVKNVSCLGLAAYDKFQEWSYLLPSIVISKGLPINRVQMEVKISFLLLKMAKLEVIA